ncbi:MAG: succinate dehydrogenase, hydrophobic membrane anchor protein [Novosphingobium sp.]
MGNGTELGRVRALGSAHAGAHHWLLQRYSAIGNMLGGLYLLFSLVKMSDHSLGAMREWLHAPLPATVVGLFVISVFWHARLGLQVLIEDYVHEHANKFAAIALLNILTFAGAAFGVLCVARTALGA